VRGVRLVIQPRTTHVRGWCEAVLYAVDSVVPPGVEV
jgi:hypothetical protein